MQVHIKQITFDSPVGQRALEVRMEVFVDEQKVPPEIEMDEQDARATHFAATVGRRVIGTCRAVRKGRTMKIGRVAVLKAWRGKGIGAQLMEAAADFAKAQGCRECVLHSQTQVIGFYETVGYVAEGPEYDEAGIPHRTMTKRF